MPTGKKEFTQILCGYADQVKPVLQVHLRFSRLILVPAVQIEVFRQATGREPSRGSAGESFSLRLHDHRTSESLVR